MNKWESIKDKCLDKAQELLNKETASTADTAETVSVLEKLMAIAWAAEEITHKLASRSQSGAAQSRDPWAETLGEN